ncbi:MAG: peptidoglycan DD-metalloendopeptidase family protein [Eudoraea sp.]|nr:peptidoglycan DD-metalloendopeptidase family protein [Eudoraea sp.]
MIRSALLFFAGTFLAFSQGELPNYANMATEFSTRYNAQDYEGVYNLYDADMQKAMTFEETRIFYTNNVNRLMGNIITMQFIGLKQGAHLYRTTFDRSIADIILSLNPQNKINGLYISPVQENQFPTLERNTTPMILPFLEEVFVYWGGTTLDQNYHVGEITQQYAYDLLMVANGTSFDGDPKVNDSYFVYGKNIVAPCDARVSLVITGVKDNIPGEMNTEQLTGNTVVLQTANEEYLLFAHLKEDSIVVEEGQEVQQGDLIGLCGNSGNSSEPHLHLSLQNTVEMENATGAKLYFDQIIVNGEIKRDYLPVKEDYIRNLN